jgi:hypothetical protein
MNTQRALIVDCNTKIPSGIAEESPAGPPPITAIGLSISYLSFESTGSIQKRKISLLSEKCQDEQ